jgi:hypothetical protein
MTVCLAIGEAISEPALTVSGIVDSLDRLSTIPTVGPLTARSRRMIIKTVKWLKLAPFRTSFRFLVAQNLMSPSAVISDCACIEEFGLLVAVIAEPHRVRTRR